MEPTSDTELVARVLAGDREAFAVLVRRYQDYAYGTAIGMLSDFELARDVVQEAFLCAYRDLPKLRDPARFGAWLHGIVKNVSRRALRELARVQALAKELGPAAATHDPASSPARLVEEAEEHAMVRLALSRLGKTSREVVSLYYVDGLSYADIAGYLRTTTTAVQGRLQRGRKQLRKELEMVARTFKAHELPDDFSVEITRLLEELARGVDEREAAIRRLAEFGAAAVDPLCEALGDPRDVVRKGAARALCRIGDPRALRPILRILYAGDWRTRDAIIRAGRILRIPGMKDELLCLLRAGTDAEKYWAMQALSHAEGDADAFQAVLQIYRGPDARIRRQALWALCAMRPDARVGLLTEALEKRDITVLTMVSWMTRVYGVRVPIGACLKALDPAPELPVASSVAGLLLAHGEQGRRALENLLHNGAQSQRLAAAMALARVGHPEAFDVLLEELLREPADTKWRRQLSQTLGWKYADRLVDWVSASKPDLHGAHAVLWALARGRSKLDTKRAGDLLTGGTPAVRAAALRILVKQKGAEAIPELRACLRDARPRKAAQEAFRQMWRLRDAALPAALEMLDSEHWGERKAALCLLRWWGKLTEQQQARGRKDPHVAVRHAADWHPGCKGAAERHPK